MKKIIKTAILCFLSFNLYAQVSSRYVKMPPDEYLVIDSIKNLYPTGSLRILVYQKAGYSDLCMNSVVFIHANNITEYWCILYKEMNDSIFPHPISIYRGDKIINDSIFSYKEYPRTGILKKEYYGDRVAFPEPSREVEKVFYQDKSISFYFEDNTETGRGCYIPVEEREPYRKEWVRIIRKELQPIFEKYCKDDGKVLKD